MTRRVVYGLGVWATVACTAMTIASIIMPRWLSYNYHDKLQYSYGLHRRCSSVKGTCDIFPRFKDCVGDKWSFCSMWRTIGFLMSFAVVLQLCTLVTFAVVLLGGVQARSSGWKIICPLLLLSGVVQCIVMSIVAFLFDHDDRFFEGWYLDNSWILCTISWGLLVLTSASILGTALYLPGEGGYELIPNSQYSGHEVEEEE
ncbi:hypothetical protein GQ43DRAFT_299597 [Delitschia confertaspora ATCC 74209]|uniref:Uncharacterized protein n=1 Tax=Delitschia confertaspora ATCC 74209 TaxID=1513339 RepID=A0A9P4JU00_9PLEO|nr:hypothetical protein GQ43DRAFT_299597 [Delitschia confertaspora ATCC 74209]